MHGNYSDESQEGTGHKEEKGEYNSPVIDKVAQANRLFDACREDLHRIGKSRIKDAW